MASDAYSVVIDHEEYLVHVTEEDGAVYVEGPDQREPVRAELDKLDDGVYRLKLGEQQRMFGYERSDGEEHIYLDGSLVEADVCKARFREEEIGSAAAAGKGELHAINATIPGQVLDVSVSEGQELEVGQTVLLLSAMKLENEIQTEVAGVVEHIRVSKDETVEKGQLLMEIKT